MYVESIQLHSAPGIGRSIRLENLVPGQVILLGPNASGKSTIGRVIRGVLWPEHAPDQVIAEVAFRFAPGGDLSRASLTYGAVNWTGDRPPVPEEVAPVWYLNMSDLIQPDRETDQQIAREISRALAGGYDLDQARSEISISTRAPRGLRNEVNAASSHLRSALDAADDLARRELELEQHRQARRESVQATSELRLVEKAKELATSRQAIAQAVASLEAFPEGLERLTGDELRLIEEARKKATGVKQKLEEFCIQATQSQEQAEWWSFPGVRPTREEIATWQERARGIQTTERELQQANGRLEAAVRAHSTAKSQVFSSQASTFGIPDPSAVEHLEGALEERWVARSEVKLAARSVSATPEVASPQNEETLRAGVQVLRAWLACPAVAEKVEPGKVPGWAIVLLAVIGSGLLIAGLVASILLVGILGAACIGIGIGLVANRLWRVTENSTPGDPRRVHQEQYQRAVLPNPEKWESESVQKHLAGLEQSLDRARESARERQERRQDELNLRAAEDRLRTTEENVRETVTSLGLSSDLPDLSLVHQAHRLEAMSQCLVEHDSARGVVEELQGQLGLHLKALNSWLMASGQEPASDGSAGLASVLSIQEKLDQLETAEQGAKDAQTGILEAEANQAGLNTRLAGLYQHVGVGLGQDDELVRRLDMVSEFNDLRQKKRDAEGQVGSLEIALAERSELQSMNLEEADERILELQEIAAQLEERSQVVAALEQEIKAASEGQTLEDAQAALEAAGDALSGAREAAVEDALGRFLLTHVSSKVSRVHAPPVLLRAQSWFRRFTRNAFHLDVHSQDCLVAMDVDRQERRQLSELSDATRVQLLLAARLASLEQAENDSCPVPLFLDEVLSTTDRQRFRAIGSCLMELSREGRQIFYATADQVEADLWSSLWSEEGCPPPQIVDLGDVHEADRWEPEISAAPPPPPTVPSPAGKDAKSYALELGIPRPRFFEPYSAWSLLYLLHDQLEGLADCIRAGITTVGRWQAVRTNGNVVPIAEELAQQVDGRSELLNTTLDLIHTGRGRPITWECIKESGAITPAFKEPVRELLLENSDHPMEFISQVANIPRFRSVSLEKLEGHLLASGHLSDVEPLDLEQVTSRTQSRLSRRIADSHLSLGEVSRFVEWVWTVLALSPAPAK